MRGYLRTGGAVDEAIHLTSAFQLAGFRHVIASLCPIEDRIAAEAAGLFYRMLPDSPDASTGATAPQDVTHNLRTEYPDHPDLGAALIHHGP